MIETVLRSNPNDHTTTLATVGLAERGKPELALEKLPVMAKGLLDFVGRLLLHLADEVVRRSLGDGATVSFGDYGRVRLEAGHDEYGNAVLRVKDVAPGAEDARAFVGRLMALTGFAQMDAGHPATAAECFGVALSLEPRNAMLLQARAWARYGQLCKSEGQGIDPGVLSLQVFGDLLRAIEFGPDRPEVYTDLLTLLKAYRPRDEGDRKDHDEWVAEIVRIACKFPASDAQALARRDELAQFVQDMRENQRLPESRL